MPARPFCIAAIGAALLACRGSSTDAASAPIDAGPPMVELIGRFDLGDAAGPKCAWPGCRIVARFEGSAVTVRMNEIDEPWMTGAPSEWDVTIDGAPPRRLVMTPGASTYVLATDLPSGVHVVELYKRSEAQDGTTQLLGFDFAGGALLPPPARARRRIEIVGDSAAAGFGIEGVGHTDGHGHCPDPEWAAHWQNFHASFGARLGDLLDAEVHGIVYSGKGLVKNITPGDDETLPVVFPRTLPIDPSSRWDFAQWQPDVVVVMAGGNDFDRDRSGDPPATLAEFTGAYRQFVATLRAAHPDAELVLTVSPSTSDDQPPGRFTRTNVTTGVQSVASEREREGDTKVSAFVPGASPPSELTACDGHGNVAFQERVAAEIAAFVAPKLGW